MSNIFGSILLIILLYFIYIFYDIFIDNKISEPALKINSKWVHITNNYYNPWQDISYFEVKEIKQNCYGKVWVKGVRVIGNNCELVCISKSELFKFYYCIYSPQ